MTETPSAAATIEPVRAKQGFSVSSKASATQVGGDILYRVFLAGYWVLLSRTLPQTAVGDIAFANAVAVPLGILLDAGLVQLLLREYRPAGGVDEGLPGSLRRMVRNRYALMVGYVAVVALACSSFGSTDDRLWIGIFIGLSYAAESLSQVWLVPARAALNMRPDFVMRTMQGIGIVVLTAGAFLAVGAHAWIAAAIYCTVFALSAVGAARIWFGSSRWWVGVPGLATDRPDDITRERRSFGAAAYVSTIYSRMDAIVIQLVAGSAALAVYTVSFKLVEAARIVPGAVSRALLARVTSSGKSSANHWPAEATTSTLAGVFLGTGLVALGPMAVSVLFGESYGDEGALAIQLLGLTTLGIGFTAPVSTLMLAVGEASAVLRWMSFTLVSTAATIVPLTEEFGIAGAAAGVLIGECVSLLGFGWWAMRNFSADLRRPSPRSLAALTVATAVIVFALTADPHGLPVLAAAAAALGLLAALLKRPFVRSLSDREG